MDSSLMQAARTSPSGPAAAPVVAAGFALMALPALTSGIADGIVSAAMFAMCVLLHRCGLLTGGADAKCAMTLALILPSLPETSVIPLIWHGSALPPVLSVLLLALAISLAGALWILILNLRAGYAGRGMLTTLEMDVGLSERTSSDAGDRPGRRRTSSAN